MTYDKEQWRATVTNGKIPRSMLAEIVPVQYDPDLGGAALMHPEAAAAMSDFVEAGRKSGHPMRVLYSYRTYAKQWEKWQAYEDRGRKPPLVAYPGTSNHGWAVTVDFLFSTAPAATVQWAHANAHRFGFDFDVPTENWHCTYQGGYTSPEGDDDVRYEKFQEGVRKYMERAKEQGRDPGDVPESMTDKDAKFGWQFARFGFTNGGKNDA